MIDQPVVTLKTLHNDIQDIKAHVYRTQNAYEKIVELDRDQEKSEERITKIEAKISALWVTHSLTMVVVGGILVNLLSK